MINEVDLKRFYFELDERKPIEVIINQHDEHDEGWFDMHYELEIGVITKGRMKREYFNYDMEIGPGEVWLCNLWEPHGFEILEAPCEVVVFVIDPTYLANSKFLNRKIMDAFNTSPAQRPKVLSSKKEAILDLSNKMKERFSNGQDADWAKLYFFELLLHLTESWEAPERQVSNKRDSIHAALRLVFDEKRLITTEEAASVCHLSVTNFRSQFKDLMGSTFSEFALQYRVRGAAAQLNNTNLTQEAVALNWGFTDASHLHKYLNRLGMKVEAQA